MSDTIRYADLWALLRSLGFACDRLDEQNHRICEFAPTDTRIVLYDHPPQQPVRAEILFGVRLQLDNGGVMSRAEFDRWAAQHSEKNLAGNTNGVEAGRRSRKS